MNVNAPDVVTSTPFDTTPYEALLASLDQTICSAKDLATEQREQREAIWAILDEAGIERATIAKFSNIDAMAISRALGPKVKA